MSMSWQSVPLSTKLKEGWAHFRERCLLKKALHIRDSLRRFFKPDSDSGIQRLQFFWAGCLGLVALGLSYGILFFLFDKAPSTLQQETPKLTSTTIETASHKVNLDEVRWYKLEEEHKKLSEEIHSLKTLFQEQIKAQTLPNNIDTEGDLHTNVHQLETQLNSFPVDTGVDTQPQPLSNSSVADFTQPNENAFHGSLGDEKGSERPLIQKFSLNLTDTSKNKHLKTVDTTIPAGAFAKTVLLSGLDASSAMNASSDPRPMLLRVVDPGTLPRRFESDLKDCHCTASAFGDLSSERVYARLEKLTCIERVTGEIIETQVAGYIAGADGKAGIRGIVASKDGQFLARSLMGGVFAGLSNVANPQNRQSQVNPFYPGSAQVSPPGVSEMFTSGMAGGASTALDRLSQYYIDRAEQLQPVIQIAAGQVVDIVFTEGTFIGAQDVHADIRKQRTEASVAEDH